MIITHNRTEYVVPDRFATALRRTFQTKDGRNGLGTGPLFDFLRERIVPWYQEVHHVSFAEPSKVDDAVPRDVAIQVMVKFRDKLIAKWMHEGYIIRVRRGVFRLNPKRGRR